MTKVDFAFQLGGMTMIVLGLCLVLLGYLKLGSSSITGLGDLVSLFFVTLFVGPFLIIWGTMILGIGYIAEASRREETTENDEDIRGKPSAVPRTEKLP